MTSFARRFSRIQAAAAVRRSGKTGALQEWNEDYDETEPGHRHISHLFALYPDHQITLRETPELAKAARATLERRLSNGGGSTGWSRAWIVNCWARLEDGEAAYQSVLALLRNCTRPQSLRHLRDEGQLALPDRRQSRRHSRPH